jgi:hypothetical protein
MKKRSYVRIFKDERLLTDLLILRQLGWTLKSLALIYGVDHSSIYKWCKITGVHRRNPNTISIEISDIISVLGVKSPQDKTYKDYLKISKYRNSPLAKYYND